MKKNKKYGMSIFRLKEEYTLTIKNAMPFISEWQDNFRQLELLLQKSDEAHDNIVLDILSDIMIDDCLSDMEADLKMAEDNNDLLLLLSGMHNRICTTIMSYAAKEGNTGTDVRDALLSLSKAGKVCFIREYLDKLLKDMEDLLELDAFDDDIPF